MAALSNVAIANWALSKLGAQRLTSLTDDTEAARSVLEIYDLTRQALLRRHPWSFAITRAALPADLDAPEYEYQKRFALPAKFVRLLSIGGDECENTDYRIEEGFILTNGAAPLRIRYVFDQANPIYFDTLFAEAFSCYLASELAVKVTQSETTKNALMHEYDHVIRRAKRQNAIELPPTQIRPNTTWLDSRLGAAY